MAFPKSKRKENIKENKDSAPPSKIKGSEPETTNVCRKRSLRKGITIEFNHHNKYLEAVIFLHHMAKSYPPNDNYPLEDG